jgi:hydroxyethylthiazole kinase
MAAFFAQATVESNWFRSLEENGGRNQLLHQGWYGRGFLQLTSPGGDLNHGNNNYYSYFRWRGRAPLPISPNRQVLQWRNDVADIPDDAAQSAGFYWVKRHFDQRSPHARETALQYSDEINPNVWTTAATTHGQAVYYRNDTARKTAAMVNIPGAVYGSHAINALTERYSAYANALVVLTDTPSFPDEHNAPQAWPEHFQRRAPW